MRRVPAQAGHRRRPAAPSCWPSWRVPGEQPGADADALSVGERRRRRDQRSDAGFDVIDGQAVLIEDRADFFDAVHFFGRDAPPSTDFERADVAAPDTALEQLRLAAPPRGKVVDGETFAAVECFGQHGTTSFGQQDYWPRLGGRNDIESLSARMCFVSRSVALGVAHQRRSLSTLRQSFANTPQLNLNC
jgi:hypothetical protein